MAKKRATSGAYRVVDDTSVRASPDPASPEYETWIFYPAGALVSDPPDHADVEGWLASGHWLPADAPEEGA